MSRRVSVSGVDPGGNVMSAGVSVNAAAAGTVVCNGPYTLPRMRTKHGAFMVVTLTVTVALHASSCHARTVLFLLD